jgi:hypothetical protein
VSTLALPLSAVAAILIAAGTVGYGVAGALVPRGRPWLAERLAWSFAAGLALVGGSVALAFSLHAAPGWLPYLVLATLVVLPARFLRIRERAAVLPITRLSPVSTLLLVVVIVGVALYALKALTEPMWANDYVAIWGFKGKTFYFERSVAERLFRWLSLSFSHPEYPLGLPLLYAGVAFLLGRWDDHAMALLFPFLQAATLLALFGWLRRRGASRELALGAAALLSFFEPLYRAFTTGIAEVPLSFGLLLLGTSICDRLDRTDRGASRRVALASVVCTATKNEGLYFVAVALVLAALFSPERKGFAARAAAMLALPAALVVAAHRLIRGSQPLRDFDFSLLARWGVLAPRVKESVATAVAEAPAAAWIGVAALAVLLLAGRDRAPGNRLFALAACGVAAYLFLPALAVRGPAWLVGTAFFRTVAALAPLVAAGAAARLIPLWPEPAAFSPDGSTGSAPGPAASAASPGRPTLSTRES